MNNKIALLISGIALIGTTAMANKHDGSDIPACQGVTDKCMSAQVTAVDKRTGKTVTGYIAGEHKFDGHGLWADCVSPLAKGKTVEGVTGVTADAAKACLEGEKATHPKKKK